MYDAQVWVGIGPTGHGDEDYYNLSARQTQRQIEFLLDLDLDVRDGAGEPLEWERIIHPDTNRPDDPLILDQLYIARYGQRGAYTESKDLDEVRAPFAIATLEDGRIVRLEYYVVRDRAIKVFDFSTDAEVREPTYEGV